MDLKNLVKTVRDMALAVTCRSHNRARDLPHEVNQELLILNLLLFSSSEDFDTIENPDVLKAYSYELADFLFRVRRKR